MKARVHFSSCIFSVQIKFPCFNPGDIIRNIKLFSSI